MKKQKKATVYAARVRYGNVAIYNAEPEFRSEYGYFGTRYLRRLLPSGIALTNIGAQEFKRATGRLPKYGEALKVEITLNADGRNKGLPLVLKADYNYGVRLQKPSDHKEVASFCTSGFNEGTGFDIPSETTANVAVQVL